MNEMRRILSILTEEMAIPDADLKGRRLYHGCSSEAKGLSIIANGLRPGNETKTARGKLQPVVGMTYFTTDIAYAAIYTVGGDMLGCSEKSAEYLVSRSRPGESPSRFGYLFVIDGKDLDTAIYADEDSIGAIVSFAAQIEAGKNLTPYYGHDKTFQAVLAQTSYWRKSLVQLAQRIMTPKQYRDAVFGLVAAQASGGKRMQKVMSARQHLELIGMGAHVAYMGSITPTEAWKFDKTLTPKLKKDGSNFFEYADRVL